MAVPINYSAEATGSGTLDGTPFTNELVDIMVTQDTSNIIVGLFGFSAPSQLRLNVTGVGTDTLPTPNGGVFADQTHDGAGFTESNLGQILVTLSSAFANYALGPIGPTSGSPLFVSRSFPTGSGGAFTLTNVVRNSTFEANLVPLPAAFPLFATGLGALGLLGWRRKRKAQAVA